MIRKSLEAKPSLEGYGAKIFVVFGRKSDIKNVVFVTQHKTDRFDS